MRTLKNSEEKEAINFINNAIEIAKKSNCDRSKCGAIIVKENEIIGVGYNSPPKNLESQKRCSKNKENYF